MNWSLWEVWVLTQPLLNKPTEAPQACVTNHSPLIGLDNIFYWWKNGISACLHLKCEMLDLNHNMSLTDCNTGTRLALPLPFFSTRLDTEAHHTAPVLPRRFFIHFAFHCAHQEAQTGVKWPSSRQQQQQQTSTTAFSKQLTAPSGHPLSSLWRSATAITSTSQDFRGNIIKTALRSLHDFPSVLASITAAVNCYEK